MVIAGGGVPALEPLAVDALAKERIVDHPAAAILDDLGELIGVGFTAPNASAW